MSAGIACLLGQSRKRRVFFSFHYQEDCFRVNQIRNAWRYQQEDVREAAGFFDASLWERSKRENEESLKSLIRDGLKNTSVTCVLVGAQTYRRPWVRYEIAQSVVNQNGLFAVGLDGLVSGGLMGLESPGGPNPLDFMAIGAREDGRLFLYEKKITGLLSGERWVPYDNFTRAVSLPATWHPPQPSYVKPLSDYCRSYRYKHDQGSQHFGKWADAAAKQVGRV